MKNSLVTFKGVTEGIFIEVKGDDILAIKQELDNIINSSSDFFQGAKLLGVKGNHISSEDLMELKMILKYKYDLDFAEGDFEEETNNHNGNTDSHEIFQGIYEGMSKFIYGTIRSGQVVEYDGNIVIVGDVNPGALLKANGNIIILGAIRGVAHAGAGGNQDSIVAAYNLEPTQLRIGNLIVRSPDTESIKSKLPEIARICNDEIIIEPYLPNK